MVALFPPSFDTDVASSHAAALTREQLLEQIQAFNPTASAAYLRRFSEADLAIYLDHLIATTEPRGRSNARWLRRGETRAIQCFVPADED